MYIVSSNELKSPESFKEREEVYYNPKKPQESLIKSDWFPLMIIGAIILYITVSPFMKTYKIPKRIELKPDQKTKFYL